MKKTLFFILALLMVTTFAFADALQDGQIAELYEHPRGRAVTFDESELITIWYTGTSNNSGFGVSGSTTLSNIYITFYEAGIATTGTRFSSYATVSLGISNNANTTSNTVENVVNTINSDTSSEFHAAIGRDATPGTSTRHSLPQDVMLGIPRRETLALEKGDYGDVLDTTVTIKDDCSSSTQILAGFRGIKSYVNQLKLLSETVIGTGSHQIKVWDGDEVVYRRYYVSPGDYLHVNRIQSDATPLTVKFTDGGLKGLCSSPGDNITVSSDWSTTLTGTSETNTSLSIIVGVWKE